MTRGIKIPLFLFITGMKFSFETKFSNSWFSCWHACWCGTRNHNVISLSYFLFWKTDHEISDLKFEGWLSGQGDPGRAYLTTIEPAATILTLLDVAGILCQDDAAKKLCDDKSSGEMFRLKAGKENCRDVVQCTAAVRYKLFASFLRCSSSLWTGFATNQMSSRPGFWSWEADLWLEGRRQQLSSPDQGEEGEASAGDWWANLWWTQQAGVRRSDLYS